MNAYRLEHAVAVPISRGVRRLLEHRVQEWADTQAPRQQGPVKYRLEVVREPGSENGALSCELTVQSGGFLWRASDYGAELQSLVLRCLRKLTRVMSVGQPQAHSRQRD